MKVLAEFIVTSRTTIRVAVSQGLCHYMAGGWPASDY